MFEYELAKKKTRRRTAQMLRNYTALSPLPDYFHFGCGRQKFDGWLNSDLDNSDVDIDLSAGKLPFEDASFSACLSQHFIEHLWIRTELKPLLRELNRVLKPGGEIWLSCPDIRRICVSYLETDCRDLVAGRQSRNAAYSTRDLPSVQFVNDVFYQGGRHKNLFDFALLQAILEGSGFSNIREVDEGILRNRFPEVRERKDGEQTIYVSGTKS